MEKFKIVFTQRGKKDFNILINSRYKQKGIELLQAIELDPYMNPPDYKMLKGELQGAVSRRISLQHRLVYQVFEEQRIIKVLMMWVHYHK